MSLESEIQRLQQAKSDIKSSLISKGIEVGNSETIDKYPEKLRYVSKRPFHTQKHVDENGNWIKPDDWPDIESISIPENESTIYFLYANHLTSHSFCRLYCEGSGMSWTRGTVENGVYTPITSSTSVGNGSYITIDLETLSGDYTVIKLTGTTSITRCTPSAWNGTNEAYPLQYNTCLMRYGNMPKGRNITFQCYYLESDNIMNFARDCTNLSLTISSAYNCNYKMARWRQTGWNITGNYTASLAYMFQNCYSLIDTPEIIDMSGWCKSNTTTCASIFVNCYTLTSPINVSNWDLTNVTSLSSIFYGCYFLEDVIGVDTWNAAPKCTTISYIFYSCRHITRDIDLHALNLGNGTATFNNINSIYNGSGINSIDIHGWNLSNIPQSNWNNSLYNGVGLTSINLTGITWPTAVTSFYQLFYANPNLEELIVENLNMSGITTNLTNPLQYLVYGCYQIKKIIFRNCTWPTGIIIKDTSASYGYLFYNDYNLEYLDVTGMDMSVFSGTNTHIYGFRNLYKLTDFYPPSNITKSFHLGSSHLLTHDSLLRVANNLVDLTGKTAQTLTIGAINKAKLTTTEQAIITGKNWTIA